VVGRRGRNVSVLVTWMHLNSRWRATLGSWTTDERRFVPITQHWHSRKSQNCSELSGQSCQLTKNRFVNMLYGVKGC